MEARSRFGKDAMTSAQTMLAVLLSCILLGTPGCNTTDKRDRLDIPGVIVAPYDTSRGEVLWAVIPPRNESGVSSVREDVIGDTIVAAVQGIRGVRCLPINRTLEVMRATGITQITSSIEAIALANALGVDGIIAGSITAYDPYDPPVLGLALALYSKPGSMERAPHTNLDPRALTMAYTDFGDSSTSRFSGDPVNSVSQHLDARDHAVLMDLKRYASGRSDSNSALRWRVYTASMDLYTQFVAHHTVGRLIDEEWLRYARTR
tara:strand:+ start:283387 stop:284175 length:789 start_codon:yes stop_codon:yes gene_type:complete